MDDREEALYFFRKLVFLLYLEIGALTPGIHKELAEKADIRNQFFRGEKRAQAAELYQQIEQETDTAKIVAPFRERTGLTLEDIRRAFAEGQWQNKHGAYNLGGPKWLKIADATLALRERIDQQDWEGAAGQVYQIKKLRTNQGYLVNQFDWTERRRT